MRSYGVLKVSVPCTFVPALKDSVKLLPTAISPAGSYTSRISIFPVTFHPHRQSAAAQVPSGVSAGKSLLLRLSQVSTRTIRLQFCDTAQ